jgi:Tfp pilus assembly protein PilV
MTSVRNRLRCQRGEALIEGLLILALLLLTVAVGVQALAYAHARSVAQAAAQDGARAAAVDGTGAGLSRASAILDAAGGAGSGLRPSASTGANRVTVQVSGRAPQVFPVPLAMPAVRASASLPLERYPEAEARP